MWINHKVYNASGSEIGAEVANIGNVNPIRYRGYYWDKEFNLYYLQSRYYDPVVGRFISADSVEYLEPDSVSGLNLYVYCNNNPVMNTDPSGHFVISFSAIAISMLIGFAIGATVSGTVAIIEEVYNDGNNTICHIYVFLWITPFDFLNYSEIIESPVLFFFLFVIIFP